MKIRKKFKIALIFLIVCLVLLISVSYAWFAISSKPEVTSIETNVGANGSLEIALLSSQTYTDPLLVRTGVGASVVEQDLLESNQHWGNVVKLEDVRYGLNRISMLPSRLNVIQDQDGGYYVDRNMLKVADFGIDGRINILSAETVSAVMDGDRFTYYVDAQNYGVRAIGTISNLSSQQIALANARTMMKAHTASASRTLKHAWRNYGSGIMDILYLRYFEGSDVFSRTEINSVRNLAGGMMESLNYADAAMRQGIIGIAASQIANESDFETICQAVNDTKVPLSAIVATLGNGIPGGFVSWATQIDQMRLNTQRVIAGCVQLADGAGWAEVEPLLDVLIDAEYAYIGEKLISEENAFAGISASDILTINSKSGVLAEIAAYIGNYSAIASWEKTGSIEIRTADTNPTPYLLQLEEVLEKCNAATGGWTRANLDDTYGFAVDLAFRCNKESDLLLQTTEAMRVQDDSEFPVTQGGGSYMRFTSENMDTEQLLKLMDTIRIGFLDDKNELINVAKLNITNYEEQEDGVYAPLYLYDFEILEDGSLLVGERRTDDTAILSLPQNSPKVVTVVVWLDGDHVDNSMVSDTNQQSMDGVLNLQFSSSADLVATNVDIK